MAVLRGLAATRLASSGRHIATYRPIAVTTTSHVLDFASAFCKYGPYATISIGNTSSRDRKRVRSTPPTATTSDATQQRMSAIVSDKSPMREARSIRLLSALRTRRLVMTTTFIELPTIPTTHSSGLTTSVARRPVLSTPAVRPEMEISGQSPGELTTQHTAAG